MNIPRPFARPLLIAAATSLLALAGCAGIQATPRMTFFVTSTDGGSGADFGGVAGADRHCQSLAKAAGAGDLTWRAYLSSQASAASPAINARDRIGDGPWHNAKGTLIAYNVGELHSPLNGITKTTALTERGEVLNGRGDTPNLHDILTGSTPDGRAYTDSADHTCGNWNSAATGSAQVGHHDRVGIADTEPMRSWNSSHGTRGCSLDALKTTGGGGRLYCFAQR